MRKSFVLVSVVLLVLIGAGQAFACRISGRVGCDANANGVPDIGDVPRGGVTVTVTLADGTPVASTQTDSLGAYSITLSDVPASYIATLGPGLPADAAFISPSTKSVAFTLTFDSLFFTQDWFIGSATCRAGACWLTGGGAKFEPLVGQNLAERGPKHSFGGNVFPGCSPTAGEGGQWNHIAHDLKLHFQGWAIDQVVCGNVSGIPPGSTSPVTPFNYIEFQGTGTLKGIKGNPVNYENVLFFARAEDRNEPGNEKASQPGGGAFIDRYFLRVYDAGGNTLLLVDIDGDPATVDPVTITGGNLQLHISSCP